MLVGCGKGPVPVFAIKSIVGVVVERGVIFGVEVATLHFAPKENEERFIVAFGQFVGHLQQQGIGVVPCVEFVAVVVLAASKQGLEVGAAGEGGTELGAVIVASSIRFLGLWLHERSTSPKSAKRLFERYFSFSQFVGEDSLQ